MKVVFLDFDGVLNTFEDHPKEGDTRVWTPGGLVVSVGLGGDFAPELVANLNTITDQTGADIVVHSTWRHNYNLNELREILAAAGVTGKVIGAAPRELPGRPKVDLVRGHFIQAWMDQWRGERVERFVILDDYEEMAHLSDYHVRTDAYEGLVKWAADKAILILKGISW